MRIIIDTDNERIIVPKKFFTELDKINAILKMMVSPINSGRLRNISKTNSTKL